MTDVDISEGSRDVCGKYKGGVCMCMVFRDSLAGK